MTSAKQLWPVVWIVSGGLLGWFVRGAGRETRAVLEFNPEALALKVNGSSYRFSEFPIELQSTVHTAFLQSNATLKNVMDDFAARVSFAKGNVASFRWDSELKSKITEKELKTIYDTALGFKTMGPFESEKVREKLLEFAVQRQKAMAIAEMSGKLSKENSVQYLWNLPFGPQLQEEISEYPVIEIGPEGKPSAEEIQVVFSYNQANSESAFYLLERLAGEVGKRLKVRLLAEYSGLQKEKAAIELVSCLAKAPRDAWVVHLRLLQDLPRLQGDSGALDFKAMFPGNTDLVGRMQACARKPIQEALYRDNTQKWQLVRENSLPMIYATGRRVSEYDPRGIEELLRLTLKNQSVRK